MTQRRIFQNEYPYFVTTSVRDGEWFFEDESYSSLLCKTIFLSGRLTGFDIISLCIMPDHLHLVVIKKIAHPRRGALSGQTYSAGPRARDGKNTISTLLYTIKSLYYTELRITYGIVDSMWQKRFYARIVTSRIQLENILKYMRRNPLADDLPAKYHHMSYQYTNWNLTQTLF